MRYAPVAREDRASFRQAHDVLGAARCDRCGYVASNVVHDVDDRDREWREVIRRVGNGLTNDEPPDWAFATIEVTEDVAAAQASAAPPDEELRRWVRTYAPAYHYGMQSGAHVGASFDDCPAIPCREVRALADKEAGK